MKPTFRLAVVLALLIPAAAPLFAAQVAGEDELSALINRELRSGGSWFTLAEAMREVGAGWGR